MKVSVAFVLAAVTVSANAFSFQQKFLGKDSVKAEDRGEPAGIEVFNNVITEAISEKLYESGNLYGPEAYFGSRTHCHGPPESLGFEYCPGRDDRERPGRPDEGRPGRPDDGRPGRPDDRRPPRWGRPPHHGEPPHDRPPPPHHGHPPPPPHHGKPPCDRPGKPGKPGKPRKPGKPPKQPEHGLPGKRPHPPHKPWPPHPPGAPPGHPHHFNMTLYDLIAKGNVTQKFFELIKDDDKIKQLLSDTSKNFTILVPINDAFDVPPHFDKPHNAPNFKGPLAHTVASYHIIPGFYPFYDLNIAKTLPTYLEQPQLGGKDAHQRVRIGREVEEGFGEGPNPHKKTAINVISKVISSDFFGTNGVVHAISHILLPPPPTLTLIHLFPTEFSTFMLAVWKSGLVDTIEDLAGKGLTIFPPANRRWEELPWDIRTFLFSPHGEKYLKALVQYHVVPSIIQYTDETTNNAETTPEEEAMFSEIEDEEDENSEASYFDWFRNGFGKRPAGTGDKHWPRGKYHADLPTLLEGKSITVDILREGWWAKWRLNGEIGLFPNDIVSREGVIQVPRAVLFPPRTDKPPRLAEFGNAREIDVPQTVEDLKARFAGLVDDE